LLQRPNTKAQRPPGSGVSQQIQRSSWSDSCTRSRYRRFVWSDLVRHFDHLGFLWLKL
jgi:hypothetical protein